MSEISERYRRLSNEFAASVEQVEPDRWSAPSPCEDWTARDLVGHVVDTHGMFLGLVGRQTESAVSVDEDPLGAFRAAAARIQHDLDDDALAGETFDGFFGTTRFDEAIDRFISLDLVVHGWDLAQATGLDATIPDDEIERIMTVDIPAFGDVLHSPGVCGPALEVRQDASAQTRLLALLGRRS